MALFEHQCRDFGYFLLCNFARIPAALRRTRMVDFEHALYGLVSVHPETMLEQINDELHRR